MSDAGMGVQVIGHQPVAMQQVSPGLEFVQHFAQYERLSIAIARSGLVKDSRPEAVLAKLLKGYELGIPPMTAQQVVYFFDGKVVVDAHAQLGIARARCGVTAKVVRSDAEACVILFSRAGWETVESSFTLEDARTAGLLGKDNWRKYPKDMLYARAITRGLKRIAPDALAGVYDRDEIMPDNGTGSGLDVISPEAVAMGEEIDTSDAVVLADDDQLADLRALAKNVGRNASQWLESEIGKGIPADAVPAAFRSLQQRLKEKQDRAAAKQHNAREVESDHDSNAAPVDPDADPMETLFGAGE